MGWDIPSKSVIRKNPNYTGNDVWQQDQQNNYKIIAQRHDDHDEDLAQAISACLNLDGINAMRANLDMGGYDFTNLPAAPSTGLTGDDVDTMVFDNPSRTLTITLKDASTLTAIIPDDIGGGGGGTVTEVTIGEGLAGTNNPITVDGDIKLETIGVAQTFSGGIETVSIDKHGRVTAVTTGASSNTNLSLGTRTASVMPVLSSTGSGVNLPLVDASFAGLMSPGDKATLDSLSSSSGITEINAGLAIDVTANSTERTVAAIQASETQVGVAELATSAETITGTDTTRVTTPAGVKALFDTLSSMDSDPSNWDFTPTGASMYLRYQTANLAEIPVALAGTRNGLLSSTDKTKLDGLVSDTGTPAILSNGSTPSLNTGITGSEVRSLIGAGTGDGDVTSVTTSTGLDHTGTTAVTIYLDLSELTELSSNPASTDEIIFLDAGVEKRVDFGNVNLSTFNDDLDYASSGHTHSQYALLTGATFTGNVTATGFNVSSTRAKKDQIYRSINDGISALQPIVFIYRDDETRKERMGFFAEDMANVYPEAVEFDESGNAQAIDYAMLVVPLIQKVQELERRLEALEF